MDKRGSSSEGSPDGNALARPEDDTTGVWDVYS